MSAGGALEVIRELAFHANRERLRTHGAAAANEFGQQANKAIADLSELVEAAKEVTEATALSAEEIKAMGRLIHALVRTGGGA